jgi:hypothetical protein
MFSTSRESYRVKFALVGQIAGLPVIHDLNGRVSVTNAVEEVVDAVMTLCAPFRPPAIIYRDSTGTFDAIRVVDGLFAGFIITNAPTDAEAFNRIADLLVGRTTRSAHPIAVRHKSP